MFKPNKITQATSTFWLFRSLWKLHEADDTWINEEIDLCGDDMCSGELVNSYEVSILSFGKDFEGSTKENIIKCNLYLSN